MNLYEFYVVVKLSRILCFVTRMIFGFLLKGATLDTIQAEERGSEDHEFSTY
jgi:hypothetical protein